MHGSGLLVPVPTACIEVELINASRRIETILKSMLSAKPFPD